MTKNIQFRTGTLTRSALSPTVSSVHASEVFTIMCHMTFDWAITFLASNGLILSAYVVALFATAGKTLLLMSELQSRLLMYDLRTRYWARHVMGVTSRPTVDCNCLLLTASIQPANVADQLTDRHSLKTLLSFTVPDSGIIYIHYIHSPMHKV